MVEEDRTITTLPGRSPSLTYSVSGIVGVAGSARAARSVVAGNFDAAVVHAFVGVVYPVDSVAAVTGGTEGAGRWRKTIRA